MPINRKFDYVVIDLIQQAARNTRNRPLNLGGISGAGGGVGSPPGGFIGQLPQTKVAYDTSEIAASGIPASGVSIVDNLNHIRYRLDVIESGSTPGSITIVDDETPATYTDIDTIHFSGGVLVTDLGGGDIQVVVSGGSGGGISDAASDGQVYGRKDGAWSDIDDTHLRLDASNSPLTGSLYMYGLADGANGIYVEGAGNSFVLDVELYTVNQNVTAPTFYLYRETSGTGNITAPFVYGIQYKLSTGTITGHWILFEDDDTGNSFTIDKDMNVDIPSGSTYNINGIPHTHAGSGAVDSVNGYTGTVVLDTDDLDDTVTTNKYASLPNIATALQTGAADLPVDGDYLHFYDVGSSVMRKNTYLNWRAWLSTSLRADGEIAGADGWIATTDTWTYSSVDDPIGVVTVNANLTTGANALGIGDKIRFVNGGNTIYGKISKAPTYSSPNTTITFLHEIDPSDNQALYLMANSAITAPHFSHSHTPTGFPTKDKWRITVLNANDTVKASPTGATWYGGALLSPTGPSIDIPIGRWRVGYKAAFQLSVTTAAVTIVGVRSGLSTANNSSGDAELQTSMTLHVPVATPAILRYTAISEYFVELTTKTTYYLNCFAGAGGDNVGFYGSSVFATKLYIEFDG